MKISTTGLDVSLIEAFKVQLSDELILLFKLYDG